MYFGLFRRMAGVSSRLDEDRGSGAFRVSSTFKEKEGQGERKEGLQAEVAAKDGVKGDRVSKGRRDSQNKNPLRMIQTSAGIPMSSAIAPESILRGFLGVSFEAVHNPSKTYKKGSPARMYKGCTGDVHGRYMACTCIKLGRHGEGKRRPSFMRRWTCEALPQFKQPSAPMVRAGLWGLWSVLWV